jgi:hypothetical protein
MAAFPLFDPLAESHSPLPSVSSNEGTSHGNPYRGGKQSDTRHGYAMRQHP